MKKILSIATCTLLFAANSVMAAALTSGNVMATDGYSVYGGISGTNAADTTASTLIGRMSKGVKAGLTFTSTAYAVSTKHNSGNTAYGTASDITAIYKSEIGVSTALSAPSAASYSSFSTWTAM